RERQLQLIRTTQGDQLHHRRCLVTSQSRTFGPAQLVSLQRSRTAWAGRIPCSTTAWTTRRRKSSLA
ncbi:MAG: hypothetical protein WCE53_08255, partial [Candidatus Acidiferrum sp.]